MVVAQGTRSRAYSPAQTGQQLLSDLNLRENPELLIVGQLPSFTGHPAEPEAAAGGGAHSGTPSGSPMTSLRAQRSAQCSATQEAVLGREGGGWPQGHCSNALR